MISRPLGSLAAPDGVRLTPAGRRLAAHPGNTVETQPRGPLFSVLRSAP
jgi:hypothetical protein